jgi:RNA polymerase sigma-70 factor (family 1)
MSGLVNDSAVVEGFRKGENPAVKHLFELHYRPLCYFAEQLLQDQAEAEDVVVEVFLKLVRKKEDFDNLGDIRAFLYQATRNACFDVLRKQKRQLKRSDDYRYLAATDEEWVADELLTAQLLEVIRAQIEELPDQCRKVFSSIFIDGKTTSVIAEEMGLSTQTVLNQKARALQLLRLALYREGWYPATTFFYCLLLLGQKA